MLKKMLITALGTLSLVACAPEQTEEAAESTAQSETPVAENLLPRTPSTAEAAVFFVTPQDGDTVPATFKLEFGISNMQVVPAGDDTAESGHHHLIIDADLPPLGLPIPANDNYRHYGDGSNVTELSLEPGTHTLQLLLGDHLHIPHQPPVYSERITITVEE